MNLFISIAHFLLVFFLGQNLKKESIKKQNNFEELKYEEVLEVLTMA